MDFHFRLSVLFCHLEVIMTFIGVEELIKSSNIMVAPFPVDKSLL